MKTLKGAALFSWEKQTPLHTLVKSGTDSLRVFHFTLPVHPCLPFTLTHTAGGWLSFLPGHVTFPL